MVSRIRVVPDTCIGAGQCVLAAPEVFDQDDDGIVVILENPPGEGDLSRTHQAVRRCPVHALRLEGE